MTSAYKLTEDDTGFYQVSDNVPARIIQLATKNCDRDDCCLSAKILFTKMAAVSNWYDKQGNIYIEDRNGKTIITCCNQCWVTTLIEDNGKECKILDRDIPKNV